jgi:ubiquinone/menaquinone biosynthesis C-methylase UbiE
MRDLRVDNAPKSFTLAQGEPFWNDGKTTNKRGNLIQESLFPRKNLTILEIGCGYGVYIPILLKHASTLVGIDINQKYLAEAQKRNPKAILRVMSAEKLEFPNGFFDVVVMIEVIEHIPNDQWAMNEISRVLKPGGMLVMTAPNKLFPFETHGIKIGKRKFRFPLTLFFLFSPSYPLKIRMKIANARVYSSCALRKTLD